MTASAEQDRVLLVGANLAGLMLAAELLRFAIQPIIIDRRSSRSASDAQVSLSPESLELFDQLGLLDTLVEKGLACGGLTVQVDGKVLAVFSYAEMAAFYPFHLSIDRNVVEEHLIQFLATRVCPVYWDTSISSFQQNEQEVRLELKGGRLKGFHRFAWMLLADGEQFDVESNLQVQYRQVVKELPFFRIAVQTDEAHNRNQHISLNRKGILFSTPVDSRGAYSFLCSARGSVGVKGNYEDLKLRVDEVLGFTIPVRKQGETTTGTLGVRLAGTFRQQRCILLGNAAYPSDLLDDFLSNQGIADARAIAWKLAYVLKGLQDASLIDTIDPERRDAAAHLLRQVDRGLQIAGLGRKLPFGAARTLLKPFVAAWRNRSAHLRTSPLSLHHARGKGIRAGDRLPFLPLYDEKKKELTDLHQCCHQAGFVLLMLGTLNKNSLFIIGQWAQQKYMQQMSLFYLPYSARNQAVFDAFEVPAEGTKMVLVRPDRYIAYVHDTVGANLVDSYMGTVMKWRF